MDEYTKKDMDVQLRLEHEAGANAGHRAISHVFPTAYGPGGVAYGMQGTGRRDDVNGRTDAFRMARRKSSPAIRRGGTFIDSAVGDGTNESAD